MAEEMERSSQLKLQAAEAKLSQTIAAKQLAKVKEMETTVSTTSLLTDYEVRLARPMAACSLCNASMVMRAHAQA